MHQLYALQAGVSAKNIKIETLTLRDRGFDQKDATRLKRDETRDS